jgi:hypothetical protein
MDPNMEVRNKDADDDKSYGASSSGYTTGTTRRELHEERLINKNLLLEMKKLEGRDNDSDNQSTKTTKSTKEKLAEALAIIDRMWIPENTAPPGQIFISPDPKARAPAPEEHTGTAAASTGPQI